MSDSQDKPSEEQRPRDKALPFPKEVLDISGDDLIDFFESHAPEGACPICGDDLKVMAAVNYDEDGNPSGFRSQPAIVGMPIHEYPEHRRKFKAPCFVVTCDTCGHLNYFMATPVVKWKKNHGRED